MNFIKKIFCRRKQFKPQPRQLRIDGVKTTLTPTPDDADLAAQALLESRIYGDKEQRRKKQPLPQPIPKKEGERDAEYYRQLSEKIKESREHDARMATRYVAYVEEQLKDQASDIATLEHGLFKHQDTVEREGGELLRRWQKCLAECLLLEMKTKTNTDLTD
jgi:hypothetical protein